MLPVSFSSYIYIYIYTHVHENMPQYLEVPVLRFFLKAIHRPVENCITSALRPGCSMGKKAVGICRLFIPSPVSGGLHHDNSNKT